MKISDLKIVVDELRAGKTYADISSVEAIADITAPLDGIGLPDFEKGKFVRKEARHEGSKDA